MNFPPHPLPRRQRGYTMIELLVVVAIIAVIAGLVLAVSGHATKVARIHRVEAERDALVNAIEQYKNKVGFYPPDNPNDPTRPPLYYELTGMIVALSGGTLPQPVAYTNVANGDVLTPSQLTNSIYPGSAIVGFANSSPDSLQVQNFLPAMSLNGMTGKLVSSQGVTNTILGVQVKGPLSVNTVDGKQMSGWSYVAKTSTHSPTNNPDTFDLWVDITAGGKNYRISNWSQNEQPL